MNRRLKMNCSKALRRLRRCPPLRALAALATLLVVVGCAPQGRRSSGPVTLTYPQLLAELTNVNSMATHPLGTSHMCSSYDRAGGNQGFARAHITL